jgi:hypothetical protein
MSIKNVDEILARLSDVVIRRIMQYQMFHERRFVHEAEAVDAPVADNAPATSSA